MSHLLRFTPSKQTKYCVFGYVRENEITLSLTCTIPTVISYLCLCYFTHGEYFEKAGNDVSVSDNQMTITKMHQDCNWLNTVYGKVWTKSHIPQIIKWTLKIDKIVDPSDHNIYFGIASTDTKTVN